jgi:hypothetical protein
MNRSQPLCVAGARSWRRSIIHFYVAFFFEIQLSPLLSTSHNHKQHHPWPNYHLSLFFSLCSTIQHCLQHLHPSCGFGRWCTFLRYHCIKFSSPCRHLPFWFTLKHRNKFTPRISRALRCRTATDSTISETTVTETTQETTQTVSPFLHICLVLYDYLWSIKSIFCFSCFPLFFFNIFFVHQSTRTAGRHDNCTTTAGNIDLNNCVWWAINFLSCHNIVFYCSSYFLLRPTCRRVIVVNI